MKLETPRPTGATWSASTSAPPSSPGDRVRLAAARADILDLVLAGKAATVEAIEQDFEGRVYLAVTVDDDPGKDLGMLRQPGHRFFFRPEEVEPLVGGGAMTARYRLDPGQSRFTVQAFATGMLSFFGHSPTFAVRDFSGPSASTGEVRGPEVGTDRRRRLARAARQVSDADRGRSRAGCVARSSRPRLYPEISFQAVESLETAGRAIPAFHRAAGSRCTASPTPADRRGALDLQDGLRSQRRLHAADVRLPDPAGDRPRRDDQAEGRA